MSDQLGLLLALTGVLGLAALAVLLFVVVAIVNQPL
jgi:hypothetical protein